MKILFLSLVLMMVSFATTIEVAEVYRPISLQGTDMLADFEGELVRARVMSVPVVVTGAMPESLVLEVAKPFRFNQLQNFQKAESNLLVLYGIGLEPELAESGILRVSVDLSEVAKPEGAELSIEQVVRLGIVALKRSLIAYHESENDPYQVEILIEGMAESLVQLRDLEETFTVKK